MGWRLDRIVDYSSHEVFMSEMVQTYADNLVLTHGKIDVSKLKPLLFDMSSKKYEGLGSAVSYCWNPGKTLKKQS
jgi:hypothetical protein